MILAVAGITAGAIAAAVVGTLGVLGVLTARRMVLGGPPRYVSVLATDELPDGTLIIRLGIDGVTTVPGQYALEFETGERVLIGDVVATNAQAGTVDRAVTRGPVPAGATRARFTGTVLTLEDFADEYNSEPTPSGAWRFDAPERSDTWVIHTHGLGASPQSTLRTVRTVGEMGLPSLVVSFGQPFEARRIGLARDDIDRVVTVIDEAVALGAKRVILCGWSFGAATSLAAARLRSEIVAGAILVSPMISLVGSATSGARAAGRSTIAVRAALMCLGLPLVSRCAGVVGRMRVRELSAGIPEGLPVLAIHSRGDRLLRMAATLEHLTSPCASFGQTAAAPHSL